MKALWAWALVSIAARLVAGFPVLSPPMQGYNSINGAFQTQVQPGVTNGTVAHVGVFGSAASCQAAAAAFKGKCYSWTFFEEDARDKQFGGHCYCSTKAFYDWFPRFYEGAVSGRVWHGCDSDADCSMNGECNAGSRLCKCNPGWRGDACTALNEGTTKSTDGYVRKNNGANASSWGGPVLRDEATGTYHMWVSEFLNNCGLSTWAQNSRIVHATSSSPTGPFTRGDADAGVLFDVFSHEPDVKAAVDPRTGEPVLVMYFTQRTPSSFPACNCSNGTTPEACPLFPAHPDTDPTKMSTAKTFAGPWSAPVPVMRNTYSDSNLTPWFPANGSAGMIGLWRTFVPKPSRIRGYSKIHLVTASNWTDPGTYSYTTALDGDILNLGGPTEDPYLYRGTDGTYHALFHNMYGCYACGGHAYSRDGKAWTYTGGDAYSDTLLYSTGPMHVYRRERPHLIFDPSGIPIALTTGVVPAWTSTSDYSFTSAVPINP